MTAPFISVCGFPVVGDTVEVTDDAKRWLIAAGWTPPEDPVIEPHGKHWYYPTYKGTPFSTDQWTLVPTIVPKALRSLGETTP